MSTALLSFEHVAFGYTPARQIFTDLNYQLRRGTLTVILGPNGIGKTTLLYMALGWLRPSAGRVLLENRPLDTYSRAELGRRVSFVPQTERQPYSYTVMEYVLFGRAPHLALFGAPGKADKEAARQALARAGIPALGDAYVDQLSGGEGQLVLIARALAQEPRVLLLDEPSANLDIHYQIQVMDLVRELVAQRGITAIIAIHDLSVAARYCDTLILMHHGKKICSGVPQEVLTPEHMRKVFRVETRLYKDPWEHLAVSARNGLDKNE